MPLGRDALPSWTLDIDEAIVGRIVVAFDGTGGCGGGAEVAAEEGVGAESVEVFSGRSSTPLSHTFISASLFLEARASASSVFLYLHTKIQKK